MKKLLTIIGLAAISLSGVNAAVLVEWNTTGFAGTETSIASSNVVANMTATAIGLGSALGTTAGGGGINTNGWTLDLNGASGNYYGFSFTVEDDYELTLTSLEFSARSSNTGPRDFAIRYSGDTFGSNIDTFSTSGSAYGDVILDLSGLGTLGAGTYEFRIGLTSTTSSNGTGTVSTGGTHRIMNFGSTSATAGPDPINLNGTIALVPEPTTVTLIGIGTGFALLRLRRRTRA